MKTLNEDRTVKRKSARVAPGYCDERVRLTAINECITCFMCNGYIIDATTIAECLHSFCRSCIIKFLRKNDYCPVCEVLINRAKPCLKRDKMLQDIIYKLVPQLFVNEMIRRRRFYWHKPHYACLVTPEERGEDTERTIINAQDPISLSLEYVSDEAGCVGVQTNGGVLPLMLMQQLYGSTSGNRSSAPEKSMKHYLQCPGMLRIGVLKKFVCNKYNVDMRQFQIDILYKRVPLPDHYTLIDIGYIFSWKRNEPIRLYFRTTDLSSYSTSTTATTPAHHLIDYVDEVLLKTSHDTAPVTPKKQTSPKVVATISPNDHLNKEPSKTTVAPSPPAPPPQIPLPAVAVTTKPSTFATTQPSFIDDVVPTNEARPKPTSSTSVDSTSTPVPERPRAQDKALLIPATGLAKKSPPGTGTKITSLQPSGQVKTPILRIASTSPPTRPRSNRFPTSPDEMGKSKFFESIQLKPVLSPKNSLSPLATNKRKSPSSSSSLPPAAINVSKRPRTNETPPPVTKPSLSLPPPPPLYPSKTHNSLHRIPDQSARLNPPPLTPKPSFSAAKDLKQFIDNCKIPASLSITLNQSGDKSGTKMSAPPVNNYIEILKLPEDAESNKTRKVSSPPALVSSSRFGHSKYTLSPTQTFQKMFEQSLWRAELSPTPKPPALAPSTSQNIAASAASPNKRRILDIVSLLQKNNGSNFTTTSSIGNDSTCTGQMVPNTVSGGRSAIMLPKHMEICAAKPKGSAVGLTNSSACKTGTTTNGLWHKSPKHPVQ